MKHSVEVLQVAGCVQRNLAPAALVEEAIRRGEGVLAASGALSVTTGKYTGRSPQDKFVVDCPEVHEKIDWENNAAFSPEAFERLYQRMLAYIQGRDVYVFDGFAGADTEHHLAVQFINERAWQNLFVHQLFIRPEEGAPEVEPDFTVLCLPGFRAIPAIDGTNSEAFIVVNLHENVVLIGGTHYAGEMKKAIFSVMNFWLPQKGILSMHCSANAGEDGNTALFFGLSGTGKTTLSADPHRQLIGDDEHAWGEKGIFNIEGGCYAKCIHLTPESEPEIWGAIRFGSVVENVKLDTQTHLPDYDDSSLTENTRTAYPVDYIPNALIPGVAGHPNTVVFLTADAFGVLPPISRLTKEQAMYHFLSGYTSKLAGTERGIKEPQATFSTCFGSPFLPLSPLVYAKLLGEKLEQHQTRVYLINTGWSGGPYGVGSRIKLAYTRAMVSAALSGTLDEVEFKADPIFHLATPLSCPGVPESVLDPRKTWQYAVDYDKQARRLAERFQDNFHKFSGAMPAEIIAAGPTL